MGILIARLLIRMHVLYCSIGLRCTNRCNTAQQQHQAPLQPKALHALGDSPSTQNGALLASFTRSTAAPPQHCHPPRKHTAFYIFEQCACFEENPSPHTTGRCSSSYAQSKPHTNPKRLCNTSKLMFSHAIGIHEQAYVCLRHQQTASCNTQCKPPPASKDCILHTIAPASCMIGCSTPCRCACCKPPTSCHCNSCLRQSQGMPAPSQPPHIKPAHHRPFQHPSSAAHHTTPQQNHLTTQPLEPDASYTVPTDVLPAQMRGRSCKLMHRR